MLCPDDRIVSENDVANGASAQRGNKRNHSHPKNIHIAASCRQCARHGFGGDGHQINDEQQIKLLAGQWLENAGDTFNHRVNPVLNTATR